MRGASGLRVRSLFSVVLVLTVPLTLYAQQNGVERSLTFAELTYGYEASAIVADGTGGLWFAGSTCSATLPTTSNAIQKSVPAQACSGLLGHMNADGSVAYLSYLGGSGPSTAIAALAIGPNGNIYVAGQTTSADFPTTTGAFDRSLNKGSGAGHTDGFVTELSPDASQIVLSTYIGGTDNDAVAALAVDSNRLIHLAGSTTSAGFPVTAGALQPTFVDAGSQEGPRPDGFYVRLSADGTSVQYGTYLGGTGWDTANGVAVDSSGSAYVAGTTASEDFPTFNPVYTWNATSPPQGFLAKFSSSGPVFSTYEMVDESAVSSVLSASIDHVYTAGSGATVAEMSPLSGAVLKSLTLHGADGTAASATAIVVDQNQTAYVVGGFGGGGTCPACGAEAGRYQTTWDAYKRQLSGEDNDAFLSIVDFRSETPTVWYSTMLGGPTEDWGLAVAPDVLGGVFIGGASTSFDSVNGQPAPPQDPVYAYQSLIAHFGFQHVTTPASPADIVLYPYETGGINPTAISGNWKIAEDQTAAGGWALHEPDGAVSKVATAAADPANDFELEFLAQANVPYHLWMRMKADNDSYQNDSVWVQFSDSVDAGGNPVWRIGSTGGTPVSLEDCGGCGDQGWGWNDNGYDAPGTPVIFATTGWHTIRIQQREDGIAIDQIVLSSSKWVSTAPGGNKNDATIRPQSYALPSGDQPPTVVITSPLGGTQFAPGQDIPIEASASDSDGSIAGVEFFADGTSIGRASAPPYSIIWHNPTPYTYEVVAIAEDNQGTATRSAPVTITVTGSTTPGLPAGWTNINVGNTGADGWATYTNGTFSVPGAGADIWGTADAFTYVYTPLVNNGWIVARVATVSNESNWVKAGVMIRGSVDPSSWHAFMLVSHAKGVAFQRRTADGASSVSTPGSLSTAPRWVKLVRNFNTISGYESADGANWTLVGSDTFPTTSVVYVGLAVSSHVQGTLATAAFDSVATSVPPPWTDGDIGSVPIKGSAKYSDGTFTVTGSGADVWGTADAFHYVFRNLEGDGTIVAHVASIQNVSPWVKAGVMIRGNFGADSVHAFMLVSASKGVAFQRREQAGGTSVNTAGSASTAPHWIKLTRVGNTFSGYESADGVNWTLVGTDVINMPTGVDIGLVVTSHSTATTATCAFDRVSIQ